MSGSAIHAALSGLMDIWSPVAAGLGFQIVRCRPYDPQEKFLCVGWDESDQAAVIANFPIINAGIAGTLDVSNLLTLWAGNETIDTVETDTIAAFDAFDAALTADRSLGGSVVNAWITAADYIPDIRTEGALGRIRFTASIQTIN